MKTHRDTRHPCLNLVFRILMASGLFAARMAAQNTNLLDLKSIHFEHTLPADHFVPPSKVTTKNISPSHLTVQPNRKLLEAPSSKSIEATDLLKEARQAQTKGDWKAAIRSFDKAEDAARRANDYQTAGVVALNHARSLQSAVALDPTLTNERPRIIQKYQIAISNAPSAQQALARNNLGAFYLQEKKPTNALLVLSELNWEKVEPSQVYICRFNYGRAAELSGKTDIALKQYELAISNRPTFNLAVDGAFRLLIDATNVTEAASLADKLLRMANLRQQHVSFDFPWIEFHIHPNRPVC